MKILPKYNSLVTFLFIVALLTITIGSLAPTNILPSILRGIMKSAYEGDCVLHFFGYAILGFLSSQLGISIRNRLHAKMYVQWLITFVSLGAFSGLIEILQPQFSPTRYCSMSDFIANISGLLTGMIVTIVFLSSILKRGKEENQNEVEIVVSENAIHTPILESFVIQPYIPPAAPKWFNDSDPFGYNYYQSLTISEDKDGTIVMK